MRAAFSSSVAAGSSRFTRRAFMPRPPRAWEATRPRAAQGPRRPPVAGLRARDQLRELIAERGELVLADEPRQRSRWPSPARHAGARSASRSRGGRAPPSTSRSARARRSTRRGRGARPARRPGAFTWRSPAFSSRRGKHGPKISSAARSRRVATRMSCTRSMSSTSSTPRAWSTSSPTRTPTILRRRPRVGLVGAQPGNPAGLGHRA